MNLLAKVINCVSVCVCVCVCVSVCVLESECAKAITKTNTADNKQMFVFFMYYTVSTSRLVFT